MTEADPRAHIVASLQSEHEPSLRAWLDGHA